MSTISKNSKRYKCAQKLLNAADDFWKTCNSEGQYGAVQWLEGTEGELIIFTRSEYRDQLMNNIQKLSRQKENLFVNGEEFEDKVDE